jgi:hypothetical protein
MTVKKEEFLALKQGPCQSVSTEIDFCSYHAMLLKMSAPMPRSSILS